MASISGNEKRGRGRPRKNTQPVHVRFPPDHLAALDKFMAEHPDNLTRPNAVRIIVSAHLRERGHLPAVVDETLRPDQLNSANDG